MKRLIIACTFILVLSGCANEKKTEPVADPTVTPVETTPAPVDSVQVTNVPVNTSVTDGDAPKLIDSTRKMKAAFMRNKQLQFRAPADSIAKWKKAAKQ